MLTRRSLFMMVMFLFLSFVLLACSTKDEGERGEENLGESNQDTNESTGDEPMEPVTVSVLVHWDEDMFNERFKEPIEEAFDHITLEHIQAASNREELEELFANGVFPDIVFEVSQEDLEFFDMAYDLDELADKHDYSFDHIKPVFLDSIRSKNDDGLLLGLPYEIIYHALFYNKDIFDAFGQDYPSDDMTWQDAINLGEKLTGEMDGTQYRGLDLANANIPFNQFSINKTDPETGDVLTDQDEFSQYMKLIDEIVGIGGSDNEDFFTGGERFVEEQTTAMIVEFIQGINWWQDSPGLNFDVAALPVWEGSETSHRVDNLIPLSIASYSEVKDEAFEVITYFTETEYQIWASRNGIGPVSENAEVEEEFFQDYESAEDKNVTAVFEHPHATPPEVISNWDRFFDFRMSEYADSDIDRNEWLRTIMEEAEIAVQEEKEKGQ